MLIVRSPYLRLTALVFTGLILAQPLTALAAPHAFFRPILPQIRRLASQGIAVRLPSRLPSGLTQPYTRDGEQRTPVPSVEAENNSISVQIKFAGCENDFPGGRGYAVNCRPLTITAVPKNLGSNLVINISPTGFVQLTRHIRAAVIDLTEADYDYPWSQIEWSQGNTQYTITYNYATATRLIQLARSTAAESPIR